MLSAAAVSARREVETPSIPIADSIHSSPASRWASLATTLDRGVMVLRYHRVEQLWRRGWRLIEPAAFRRVSFPRDADWREPARWDPRVWRSCAPRSLGTDVSGLGDGRLRLLSLTAPVGRAMEWTALDRLPLPKLWRFSAHYHEFLVELIEQDEWGLIEEALDAWLIAYPSPSKAFAWHPYCVSRRIPVWAALLRFSALSESLRSRLIDSLGRQARYLSRRFERDLGGNHLWDNARALLIAGHLFDGETPAIWRRLGKNWLERCLEEQLSVEREHEDREHEERSPGYQVDLARGLEECAHWIERGDPAFAERLRRVSESMNKFLDAIRHPDGVVPLFGDTTLDVAGTISAPRSARRGPRWIGSYHILEEPNHFVVFDSGDLGPDHLPAHSHADLLTLEMSLFGQRAIVDRGVFAYEGERRGEFRRSEAHNVLIVDGRPLADVWSSFRMGRRGHVLGRASGLSAGGGSWVRAWHDAYLGAGVLVERILFSHPEGILVSAHVVTRRRSRVHEAREFIHWSPLLRLSPVGGHWRVEGLSRQATWAPASSGLRVEMIRGDYSEQFYRAEPCPVLRIEAREKAPFVVAWAISTNDHIRDVSTSLVPSGLCVRWGKDGLLRQAIIPRGAGDEGA